MRQKCDPEVTGFRFDGIGNAVPAGGLLDAIHSADLVIFCPSNPWVSLDPILAVPGIRQALHDKDNIVGVSPIIGGAAFFIA